MNQVRFNWKRRPSQASAETLRRVILEVLDAQQRDATEVHVLITGDPQIRELNREYRSLNRATDVLSFADGSCLPNGTTLLGEIIISLDTAKRQAAAAGITELRELSELVLHGTLHLLGHDHSTDNGSMDRIEQRLRKDILN